MLRPCARDWKFPLLKFASGVSFASSGVNAVPTWSPFTPSTKPVLGALIPIKFEPSDEIGIAITATSDDVGVRFPAMIVLMTLSWELGFSLALKSPPPSDEMPTVPKPSRTSLAVIVVFPMRAEEVKPLKLNPPPNAAPRNG